MQTRQVDMRRWSIISHKPFDAVVAAVEAAIGRPNMGEFAAKMAAALTYEEMQTVVRGSISEIGLMEFMRLDHGAVLAKAGVDGDPKSVRLIMGIPLIMQSMARLVPAKPFLNPRPGFSFGTTGSEGVLAGLPESCCEQGNMRQPDRLPACKVRVQ